jgi:hypothetical protein
MGWIATGREFRGGRSNAFVLSMNCGFHATRLIVQRSHIRHERFLSSTILKEGSHLIFANRLDAGLKLRLERAQHVHQRPCFNHVFCHQLISTIQDRTLHRVAFGRRKYAANR